MKDEQINVRAQERGKVVSALNIKCRCDFEKNGGIDNLTQYVMSETIAPIEDYVNVVNIIRSNYCAQISGELLIIGAYLATQWTSSENELLTILELMYEHMPNKEKAIIHYLKADRIYVKNGLKENAEYLSELHKSLEFTDVLFVNNRRRIAELSSGNEARKYYREALSNVQKVYSQEEMSETTSLEDLLSPQSFINEFILGTYISSLTYEEIKEKMERL